jgi:hypothetical protein
MKGIDILDTEKRSKTASFNGASALEAKGIITLQNIVGMTERKGAHIDNRFCLIKSAPLIFWEKIRVQTHQH